MVTIRDVARHASVSTATVSRVLNDHPHVREEIRQLVWSAIQVLGYPIPAPRRAEGPGRTVLLCGYGADDGSTSRRNDGVVGTDFARLVLAGAQAALHQRGATALLRHSGGGRAGLRQQAEDGTLAGLIILGGQLPDDFVADLRLTQLPFVVAGGCHPTIALNCVTADYQSGVVQAVEHLARGGRKQIALLNGPPITTTSAAKYYGYRLGLSLHDLPYAPAYVAASAFTPEAGYEQTLRLLEQAPELDAIFYGDDYMAMGGLRALKEQGRRVPDDVAVVGLHDYEIARFTDPPLTSVFFDMPLMGRLAAERLGSLIDDPEQPPWQLLVPTSLVVRAST